ncbi:AAA family ATPase [Candidatus Riflebacteria bacterium]
MFDIKSTKGFKKLTEEQLAEISGLGKFGTVRNSEEFLKMVRQKKGLYLIGDGSFRVLNSKMKFLFYVEKGEFFGEFEILGLPKEKIKINLLSKVSYFFIPETHIQKIFEISKVLQQEILDVYKKRIIYIKNPQVDTQQGVKHGKADIIYVLGPKGGCGKTMVACNLGAYLSKHLDKKVICLDLSLELGNLKDFFTHEEDQTKDLSSLLHESDWNKESVYRNFIYKHRPSGVHCIWSPNTVEQYEGISTAKVAALLKVLSNHYDFIIIDTSPFLSTFDREVIKSSTDILVVMDLESPSIANVIKTFNFLGKNEFYNKEFKILLNRSDRPYQIKKHDIPKSISDFVSFFLPSDVDSCLKSINEGNPLVINSPRAGITEAFAIIARDYAHIEKQEKKSMFSVILNAFNF